jgi:hypothetical protein
VGIQAGVRPRSQGELLKLGLNIGETSVSKYLVRSRKPPFQLAEAFRWDNAPVICCATVTATSAMTSLSK